MQHDLDPEIAAVLAETVQRFGPAPNHLPGNPVAARQDVELRRAFVNLGGPQMREKRDLTIDLAGRSIPARFFVPEGETRGLLVWFHGGGWVQGSIDTHDRLCRALAAGAGTRVLSIGYRKAPEFPFPVPLDDCFDAFVWARKNAEMLGTTPDKLAVGGDSAGGNLAFGVTVRLAAQKLPVPAAHIGVYGVYDCDLDTQSYTAPFGDGRFGLSRAAMAMYWEMYCPDAKRREHPEASPLRAADMTIFKRPYIMAAGLDPLRDDSRRMRDKLVASGVDTVYVEFPHANHAFVHLGAFAAVSRETVAQMSAHLARAFSV